MDCNNDHTILWAHDILDGTILKYGCAMSRVKISTIAWNRVIQSRVKHLVKIDTTS